jgi:hypothetical protein
MATLEATFFVFLFHSSRFYSFTTNVTRALPLEAIKGEAGATSRGEIERSRDQMVKPQQLELTVIDTTSTTTHQRLRSISLSQKLVTPTTSTLVQGNMNCSKTH